LGEVGIFFGCHFGRVGSCSLYKNAQ
jgi:hypothetical protein